MISNFALKSEFNPLTLPNLSYCQYFRLQMSRKIIIETPLAPAAIGPYSQAVRAGDTVYVSGCIAIDPTSRKLVDGGIEEQTRQVLENLKNIVEASGSSLTNVVKCTVLLTDMSNFATVNSIYAEYFPENPPARMTYAVAGLPANALVEIDATAII